jgi:hypothetical protein
MAKKSSQGGRRLHSGRKGEMGNDTAMEPLDSPISSDNDALGRSSSESDAKLKFEMC